MAFFSRLRQKTLTFLISTLFLCFIRPWQPHQTINTFYQESTHFFSSIRPWSDGLFLQFKGENTDLYHFNSILKLHQTMAAPSDHQHILPRVDSFFQFHQTMVWWPFSLVYGWKQWLSWFQLCFSASSFHGRPIRPSTHFTKSRLFFSVPSDHGLMSFFFSLSL